jgi:hypothetical protein
MHVSDNLDSDVDVSKFCNFYDTTELNEKSVELGIGKQLTCMHINCRSIVANFDSLRMLIDALTFEFDVIVVTESWLLNSAAHLYNIPGYKLFCKQRPHGLGGGICIYVKDVYNASIIPCSINFNSFQQIDILINSANIMNKLLISAT